MNKALDKSERIKNRFIELLQNNELYIHDELFIINALFNKFELVTISDYAKRVNKSYNGVLDIIKRNKVATIIISNQTFILNKL